MSTASGCFVIGTDTGVGKTLVACALLHALARSGRRVAGMKPVAAGIEAGRYADVEALGAAGNVGIPAHLANPYAFEPPIAPHIAADLAGREIDIEVLAKACAELRNHVDFLVVEGVGGFLVPLNARHTSADLALRLALPLVLVVGMRLGCLNHALLTREAIAARGLHCAGWVANNIVADLPYRQKNIRALEQRLDCPLLGELPWLPAITAREAATHLALAPLLAGQA